MFSYIECILIVLKTECGYVRQNQAIASSLRHMKQNDGGGTLCPNFFDEVYNCMVYSAIRDRGGIVKLPLIEEWPVKETIRMYAGMRCATSRGGMLKTPRTSCSRVWDSKCLLR